MGTTANRPAPATAHPPLGEVVTISVDLTNHQTDATVETTVITEHGTVVVTVDPHAMH